MSVSTVHMQDCAWARVSICFCPATAALVVTCQSRCPPCARTLAAELSCAQRVCVHSLCQTARLLIR